MIIHELESMIISWWWGALSEHRKIYWISKDKLFLPKKKGGLGFKYLLAFNKAMLAKACWRIITCPNSLSTRLLKSKYCIDNDFWTAEFRQGGSCVWQSLCWGKELLVKGLRWRLGDGTKIRVFKDPWVPGPFSYKLITLCFDEEI